MAYNGKGKYDGNKFAWFDHLAVGDHDVTPEFINWATLGSDESWWPVVAYEVPWLNCGPYVDAGKKKIVVVCVYQLVEDRLVGWWLVIDKDGFPRVIRHRGPPDQVPELD